MLPLPPSLSEKENSFARIQHLVAVRTQNPTDPVPPPASSWLKSHFLWSFPIYAQNWINIPDGTVVSRVCSLYELKELPGWSLHLAPLPGSQYHKRTPELAGGQEEGIIEGYLGCLSTGMDVTQLSGTDSLLNASFMMTSVCRGWEQWKIMTLGVILLFIHFHFVHYEIWEGNPFPLWATVRGWFALTSRVSPLGPGPTVPVGSFLPQPMSCYPLGAEPRSLNEFLHYWAPRESGGTQVRYSFAGAVEGHRDSAGNGSKAELSFWPDFLRPVILQNTNVLNICFSQQEPLFLTYLSSSALPWDYHFWQITFLN